MYRKGFEVRDSILFMLEVHSKGATVPELSAYLSIPPENLTYHVHQLERAGMLYSTPLDRKAKLWHLRDNAPTLTPPPQARQPQVNGVRATRHTKR